MFTFIKDIFVFGIKFWAAVSFILLVALGAVVFLFSVEPVYILIALGGGVLFFVIRLVIVYIQVNRYHDNLAKIEKEKARVKYVIIK